MSFTRFITVAASAALLALLSSCGKEGRAYGDAVPGHLTVNFTAESVTRASDTAALEGESAVNSLDVFIFRVSSLPDGGVPLEVRRKANAGEIAAGSLRMEVTPGEKRIYVLANVPERLSSAVTDEASLQASFSLFTDNAAGSFVMAGSPEGASTLVVGAGGGNDLTVELRRLVARVKVERVSADFRSLAARQGDLKVLRVYLTYVPRRVRPVNGDVDDVFGTPREVVVDGRTLRGFYDYEAPEAGDDRRGSGENGFLNPGVLTGGSVVIDPEAAALTCRTLGEGEGWLYSKAGLAPADAAWVPSEPLYLYAYPNASEGTLEEGVHDFTTKLVVEASMDGEVFWYPIPIAKTQPNWAYTVNGITLTTRGSGDPNQPVRTKAVVVDVTVSDWTTGEVIGRYNRTDGSGGFVF